jgi:hypothetical protein
MFGISSTGHEVSIKVLWNLSFFGRSDGYFWYKFFSGFVGDPLGFDFLMR